MSFVFTVIAYVIISGLLSVSLVDIRERIRRLKWFDGKLDLSLK